MALLLALPLAGGWVLDSPTYRYIVEKENGYEWMDTSTATPVQWFGPDSFNLSNVVTRWSLPSDPYTDDELASGISWALHPSFCSSILPLFPEENVGADAPSGCSGSAS